MNINRRTKAILAGAVALALVFLSSVSYAEHMGKGPGRGRIMEKLDLTPEQEKQLQEHRDTHMEEMKQLSQTLKGKREELRSELEKQKIDKAKVNIIIEEIKPLLSRQLELKVGGILAMREVLTAEQFEKLQGFRKKGRGKCNWGRCGSGKRRNKESD